MSMFCYQCEQTGKGSGCTTMGVCGKDPTVAALQDVIVHVAKGLARYVHRLRGLGVVDREADVFLIEALFATVTNVNFDPDRLEAIIRRGAGTGERLKARYVQECKKVGREPEDVSRLTWDPSCVHNLVRFLVDEKKRKGRQKEPDTRPVGIVVKGCDSRALVVLLQEKFIERGDVHILAAGRRKKEIGKAKLDTSVFTTPVVANGVFYVTSMTHLYAVRCDESAGE